MAGKYPLCISYFEDRFFLSKQCLPDEMSFISIHCFLKYAFRSPGDKKSTPLLVITSEI